MFKAASLEIA